MGEAEVRWSDFRDWQAGNATVREAVERSPHYGTFMQAVAKFAAKANRHERVDVYWWCAPFVYVGVVDIRKHYPCGHRALVSFDLTGGTFADPRSKRRYAFARRGWGAFVDGVACRTVARYGECTEPTRERGCPPPATA